MDFFARQDEVKSRSRALALGFGLAVLLAVVLLYFAAAGGFVIFGVLHDVLTGTSSASAAYYLPENIYGSPPRLLALRPLALVAPALAGLILLFSLGKTWTLRQRGAASLMEALGGRPVGTPVNALEKRLLHVAEEMALAAGMPRPALFVLTEEESINAVTAGLRPDDAAVAVTKGALTRLNRQELQAVLAHEFAHIFNGDYRLNLTMAGWVYGFLCFSLIGKFLLQVAWHSVASPDRSSRSRRDRKNQSGELAAILGLAVAGLVFWLGGLLGKAPAAILQAAQNRQREYLADAFAVQFTRDSRSLAGALKKIAALNRQGQIVNENSKLMRSFFLVSPASFSLLATHPPLTRRIRTLEPDWDGSLPPAAEPAPYEPEPAEARLILDRLPPRLAQALEEPAEAAALVAALFLPRPPEEPAKLAVIDRHLGATAAELALKFRAELGPQAETGREERKNSPDFDALRVDLLNLLTPNLRSLAPEGRTALERAVDELIRADGEFDFFELAAGVLLTGALTEGLRPRPEAAALRADAAKFLAYLAGRGHDSPAAAEEALKAGLEAFEAGRAGHLGPQAEGGVPAGEELYAALNRLAGAGEEERGRLLKAGEAAAGHDARLTDFEREMLRAAAAAWELPRGEF